MSSIVTVKPAATLAQLFPPDTVYAPRSTAEAIRWALGDNYCLDTVTGATIAIAGEMPLICHRHVATPSILAFFRRAGIQTPPHLITYDTEEEALSLAREQLRSGKRLAYVYPPPPVLQADSALVLPVSLYNWLNDKSNLERLVDVQYLPPFRLVASGSWPQLADFLPGQAVFIKACYPGASGGGRDVRYCPDVASRATAQAWLAAHRDEFPAARVEQAMAITDSWCLSFGILAGEVRYLGAAKQLFSEPAHQYGSRIGPDELPPATTIEVGQTIARRAGDMGYRGVAGFDIGVATGGRTFVFDLNFRLVSSLPMVLLHASAVARINACISQYFYSLFPGPLELVLERLASFADSGKFVPTRIYEATPFSGGRSVLTGIVVANTQQEIEILTADMRSAIAQSSSSN